MSEKKEETSSEETVENKTTVKTSEPEPTDGLAFVKALPQALADVIEERFGALLKPAPTPPPVVEEKETKVETKSAVEKGEEKQEGSTPLSQENGEPRKQKWTNFGEIRLW